MLALQSDSDLFSSILNSSFEEKPMKLIWYIWGKIQAEQKKIENLKTKPMYCKLCKV